MRCHILEDIPFSYVYLVIGNRDVHRILKNNEKKLHNNKESVKNLSGGTARYDVVYFR